MLINFILDHGLRSADMELGINATIFINFFGINRFWKYTLEPYFRKKVATVVK